MANYLVTGGCGFIGSHLVDALLARGDQVRVLDDLSTGRRENLDPAAELIVGDVADLALTHDAMDGMDGCFHLAAIASVQQSVEHWYATHRANQAGRPLLRLHPLLLVKPLDAEQPHRMQPEHDDDGSRDAIEDRLALGEELADRARGGAKRDKYEREADDERQRRDNYLAPRAGGLSLQRQAW